MVSAGVIVMTVLVFALVIAGQVDAGPFILTLGIDSLVILGWLLILRGRWQISAFFLPLVSLAIAGYIFLTVGPGTAAVLQIVLAVLLAGMLSGNSARWFMVLLSILVYLVAGWVSGWLDFEVIMASGVLLIITLLVIALLESFFADQLNKSCFRCVSAKQNWKASFALLRSGLAWSLTGSYRKSTLPYAR
jgi:hypothetical protein